jgi:environmental stress-induced protein Ves
MPWRNGLGESTEIAIFPAGVDFATNEFLWRISSAKVSSDNQFSVFENHDRILTVLNGGALSLQFEKKPTSLLKPYSALEFDGRDQVSCHLRGEKVVDLGIIYNRKWIKASMDLEDVSEQVRRLKFNAGTSFVICVEKPILINEMKLEYLDAFKVEDSGEVLVHSLSSETKIAIIHIQSRVAE